MLDQDSPLFGREAFLNSLNDQLLVLSSSVEEDLRVVEHHNMQQDTSPAVFLVYTVKNEEGDPLAKETLEKFDTTLKAVEKLEGFQKIQTITATKKLNVFLDFYINFTATDAKQLTRIVIEGMRI